MKNLHQMNLLDAVMLVMGSMIGSGIFIVSAGMSRELLSPEMLLLAWFVTGVLTLLAALSYAELGAAMPKAGGQYVYLQAAYGKLFGFLYGWTLFTVIQTGTIAAVAVAFARFTGILFPSISEQEIVFSVVGKDINRVQLLGIAIILLLTLSNFRAIKKSAFIQNIFTMSKVLALLFLIVSGLYWIADAHPSQWTFNFSNLSFSSVTPALFAAALVGSIFSSDAWNNITFSASEIQNPEKNLPRSLVIGSTGVTLLYILANIMYLKVLPFDAIQHAPSDRVGTLMMQTLFGESGAIMMAVLIMVSTFGCINGLTLSGARVYYAMAKDGFFFKQAGQLNKNQSPQTALIIQGIWAALLTLSGSYGDLLDYVVFAVLMFYILTVAGVIVLRFKQPNLERPYKVLAYPFIPILYCVIATGICISLLVYKPEFSYPGLGIVLAGVPIYYWLQKKA